MIASYVDHSGATLGMTQNSAHNIGVTLLPAPLVLLYLPGVYDVAHQIQGFAAVVFKKIVELVGLTISGTQMNIADEYGFIGGLH
jgi:hypothetical protein